jgi:parallel beta-helix repeat protein
MKTKCLFITFATGVSLILALLWLLNSSSTPVTAAPECQPRQAMANVITVCVHGGCDYSNIQAAVDAASDGEVIKVAAGRYTGVHARPRADLTTTGLVTQVVYISKTVTIQGGYTTTNWITPYPITQPTTLDAQGEGRALYITGDIHPTVEGLRVTGGDATGLGGWPDPWGPEGDGGAGIYVISATTTITNNHIFSNTGHSAVSLVYSGGTFSGNTVTANISYGLMLYDSSDTITGNTITDNNRTGLFMMHNASTVTGNTIAASSSNGGVFLFNNASTLSCNRIVSNTGDEGAGLYLNSSPVTLINNVIADNYAYVAGSGVYILADERQPSRWLHNTIARNSGGDGSGVYVTGFTSQSRGTHVFTNTILVSHTVGISVTGSSTVTLNGVVWHNVPITVSQSVSASVNVQDQHTGDPVLVDPDTGGYHIGFGSAAVDAGVDAGVTTDIDGDPRPIGPGYDMGADEWPGSALQVTKRAIPDPVQPGVQLTYTIHITNATGVDLQATITDTLPLSITLDETSGGTLALPGGTVDLPDGRVAVTWTDVITASGGLWMGTLLVTVDEGYAGPLTNLVEVTTKEGATGEGSVTVIASRRIYLPLVLRES